MLEQLAQELFNRVVKFLTTNEPNGARSSAVRRALLLTSSRVQWCACCAAIGDWCVANRRAALRRRWSAERGMVSEVLCDLGGVPE